MSGTLQIKLRKLYSKIDPKGSLYLFSWYFIVNAVIIRIIFMNNIDKGIKQVAEELKKEIEKLQSLHNDKINIELMRLKKLLNIV